MIGSRLAHFEVKEKLGEGGMGTVYRAEDGRLGREVALKILSEAFAADPDRIARFGREARLLAALAHPNIAGIYEVGSARIPSRESTPSAGDDPGIVCHYLAMELARGRTLAERLERGALPVSEAIPVALEIAKALEAAHRQGIVHRDLKPANVAVDDDGDVKVLDFGLAKAFETTTAVGSDATALAQSPTLTARLTNAGMILGTAAYMSPEQARGKEADKRSDNWSFGVVLWEMLTGRRAFGEKTVSESLAAVLMRDPDLDELPPTTPPGVRRLLERCLQKDPDQRLHDIADGRLELEAALRGEPMEAEAPSRPSPSLRLWQGLAAVLLLATLGLAGLEVQRRLAEPRALRATVLPPEGAAFDLTAVHPGPVTVSPDGTLLAFTARAEAEAEPTLWVRPVDSLLARELPSTEGAGYPFWSPDGRHVGFFTLSAMKKIAVAGGPTVTLARTNFGKGASWSPEGWIVFTSGSAEGISVVPEAGGEARQLTTLDPEAGENSHRHPRFLPDGERFLYFVPLLGRDGVLRVGSIAEGEPMEPVDLVETEANGQVASGRLLFVRDGTLVAQPFDPDTLEARGEAVPLVEDILLLPRASLAVFSASDEGTFVYQTGEANVLNRLVWIERDGSSSPARAAEGRIIHPRLGPDGNRVLVEIQDPEQGTSDIWIQDLERGTRNRLTFDPRDDWAPVWSPDGERFAYAAQGVGEEAVGKWAVWVQPIVGTREPELLVTTDRSVFPIDWSPDGRWVTAILWGGPTRMDSIRIPTGGGEPEVLFDGTFNEEHPAVSPDGRWLAYISSETGEREIYLTTFPQPGRKWQVSLDGGYAPTWRADGRELFYRTVDALWAAEVDGTGETVDVGAVTRLFDLPPRNSPGSDYDVSADGQRFLFSLVVARQETPPITIVLGWDAELP